MRDARHAGVLRVAEDRGAEFWGPALALQFANTDEGMLCSCGVALVVEVVEQTSGGVELDEASAFVAGETEAVGFCLAAGGDADFNSDGMFAETFTLGPLGEQLPGLVAAEFLLVGFDQSHLRILRVAHLGSRFFGVFRV